MTRKTRFPFRPCLRRGLLGLLVVSLSINAEAVSTKNIVPDSLPGAPAYEENLRKRLEKRLAERSIENEPRTQNLRPDGSPLYTNRLVLETSPYLLQHAHNPVNWYPWGDEAFDAARKLGRPVLLSIGYSTCHWCHVMEEESFDNPEIAEYLNAHFIAIKVDREARPDIDDIYMTAVHVMGQRGGWPLNVWLNSSRKPFYGGTYFPPRSRGRTPGLMDILEMITKEYAKDASVIDQQAEKIAARIISQLEGTTVAASLLPDTKALDNMVNQLKQKADPEWGGIGTQPKFPSSLPIRLLLRTHRRTGDADVLAIALLALEKMDEGGIHDHIGGGFHRYSTDRTWLVPHFEIMLYDNALLAVDYLEAWQTTGRERFREVSIGILRYIERAMTAPEGGFYSASDADSQTPEGESEEGWYFTWTSEEIEAVLGADRAKEVGAYYGVSAEGNFESRSILHISRPLETIANELDIPARELRANLFASRAKLQLARDRRPAPHLDDKIIVAWNALMISAFTRAGFAFDEPDFARAAERAANFILVSLRKSGRLNRLYKEGRAEGPAFLEDYAFMIQALLDLYEATASERWLREALALQSVLDQLYRDDDRGGYFKSADDAEQLLVREKSGRDGAIPSGQSIETLNLLRLHDLTTRPEFLEMAEILIGASHDELLRGSLDRSELYNALDYRLDLTKEIVLVAPASNQGIDAMLEKLRRKYVPNRVLMVVQEGSTPASDAKLLPLISQKTSRQGRATAYVCENRTCSFPTDSTDEFERQILTVREYAR